MERYFLPASILSELYLRCLWYVRSSKGATGKDWMTGRELGTGERWLRSALGPLDIIPGIATVKRFGVTTVRSASRLSNVNKLSTTNPSIASSISESLSKQTANLKNVAGSAADSVTRQVDNVRNLASGAAGNVKNLVSTANDVAIARLSSARQLMDNKLSLAKQNVDNAVVKAAEKADDVATNLRAGIQPKAAIAGGGKAGPEPVTIFSDKAKEAGFVKSSVSDGVSGVGKRLDGSKNLAKGTGNVKHLDDVPRIKEVEVNFKRNDKHDSEEFARQLKDQEKGMNELTVDEYLKNREKYIEQGRAIKGNAA